MGNETNDNGLNSRDSTLKSMGIVNASSLLHPNRYWCEFSDYHVTIRKHESLREAYESLMRMAYAKGVEAGVEKHASKVREVLLGKNH